MTQNHRLGLMSGGSTSIRRLLSVPRFFYPLSSTDEGAAARRRDFLSSTFGLFFLFANTLMPSSECSGGFSGGNPVLNTPNTEKILQQMVSQVALPPCDAFAVQRPTLPQVQPRS